MKKCICKEPFEVDCCDDDGFSTEKTMQVKKGERFSVEDGAFRLIDGEVRLVSDSAWLEISKSTFDEHFDTYEEDEINE